MQGELVFYYRFRVFAKLGFETINICGIQGKSSHENRSLNCIQQSSYGLVVRNDPCLFKLPQFVAQLRNWLIVGNRMNLSDYRLITRTHFYKDPAHCLGKLPKVEIQSVLDFI